MDIDDILAEVDGRAAAPRERLDHQELARAWVNERNAPELLEWPGGLMERVLERIRTQVRLIQLFLPCFLLSGGGGCLCSVVLLFSSWP